MCSIVGFFNKFEEEINFNSFFNQSFDFMKSRGPDSQAILHIDSICSLGHQRLSIIDIGANANQPMIYKHYTIIFNGEIYNYIELKNQLIKEGFSFQTKSDTEVLLIGIAEYGLSFLNKLNGMFAFALYDKKNKKLFLVRDRFGIKPIHYTKEGNVIYFSSEIKPLINLKKNKKVNINIYQNFFKHTATDYNEETFIEEIYQVEGGGYIEITKNNLKKHKWYFQNDFNFDESVFTSKNQTVEFVEELLTESINIRMRSDVPICLTLSGGIDSTTIYTLIREKLQNKIQLFTFIHPNSPTNEYEKVKRLCNSYNDIVCVVQSQNATNDFDGFKKDLEIVEFPIWGISTRAYSEVYNAIKEGGFKVVLEGHGSDEQLGGYPYMVESACYDYFRRGNFMKALEILKIACATEHTSLIIKSNLYKKFVRLIGKFLLKQNSIKYFQENIDWTFEFKILPIVLRAFDRLSMGSSVESRAPFMDYRIVELFKKLPIEHKVNTIGNKAILREILKKYKKNYIYDDKQKMGFASDIPAFFSSNQNKSLAKNYITKFDMEGFEREKQRAFNTINKEKIDWSDSFEMSKVFALSIINELYNLEYYSK